MVSTIDALTNTVVAEVPTGTGTPESVGWTRDDITLTPYALCAAP
ncbi:hypothetical protein [Streptomyces sp. NBC_01264]|nr:hypothetical protein [Streptomyces sp. NBC_01264]MCX4781657.1 hypothetical protein [Streptomyces sp. NBC_01264]